MRLKEILIKDLQKLLYTDDDLSFRHIIKAYLKYPCYSYVVNFRLCNYLKTKKLLIPIFILVRINYRRLSIKLGIQIPYTTKIEEGFSIHHYNCIVIHGKSIIGKNLDIRQGVTIGDVCSEVPIIGDNVYIGAGAKIIGKVVVGSNVIIGANSVVTKDIPNNTVVAGVPAKAIKKINNDAIKLIDNTCQNDSNC